MPFCTAVNCMDGRAQLPVNRYLQQRFGAEYVDTITELGPVAILTGDTRPELRPGIDARLDISVHHHSVGIAVVAHHDCAGNPAPKESQLVQIGKSVEAIRARYPDMPVIGLWVDEHWRVEEV